MRTPAACTCLLLAASAASASEGGADPFAGTIIQAITAVVVVALLFVLLRRYAWGPILKGLQDRETKIRTDLQHAEDAARQAQTTLQEYQRQLAEAQAEARRIIEQARSDAQRAGQETLRQTQEELTALKQRAQQEIRTARQEALADIYAQGAVVATSLAGRILQRELKPEDQQRLIQETLAALPGPQRN